MQRIRSSSSFVNKNFPILKKSMFSSKGMISISKVDIDSRSIQRERNKLCTAKSQKQHGRTNSVLNGHRNKQSEEKVVPKKDFEHQTNNFRMTLRQINAKQEQAELLQNNLIIDKSKVSSKTYGIIKGYSANSHSGPHQTYNEDRICIVTNLNKTTMKSRQISFFGIYDGVNGTAKADYMRDNFHAMLASDGQFLNDVEKSFYRNLKKINLNYHDDPRFIGDLSLSYFVIAIIIGNLLLIEGEDIYCFYNGTCRFVFSKNYGGDIHCPLHESASIKDINRKSKFFNEIVIKKISPSKVRDKTQVLFKRYHQSDGLDFIVLGSEGVFQSLKPKDLSKKVWLFLLTSRMQTVHLSLGEANNSLLSEIFSNPSTKNTSTIIIAFKNVVEALRRDEELELPYQDNQERLPTNT